MRFTKKLGALLCSAAIASIMVVPAAPAMAEGDSAQAIPTVNKTLQVNNGSSVEATFEYTATAKAIDITDANGQATGAKTYTDGPAAAIADITLNAANEKITGHGAITFGGKTDASAFTHAGVYAWEIVETANTYSGKGEMQYDPQVYTLITTVENDDSATAAANKLKLGNFYVVKGATDKTTNDKDAKSDLDFTNTYTEKTTENGTDLVIQKTVTGAQGDKTKKFNFKVTFTAPTYLPLKSGSTTEQMTAAETLNLITVDDASTATDVVFENAVEGATTRAITFKATDSQSVTFKNVVAGTTYAITEDAETGYTATYKGTENGTEFNNNQKTSKILIGEHANTGTMTNDYESVSPTGILINNLPYVLLIGVPLIALAAWFVMRRKRAYQD